MKPPHPAVLVVQIVLILVFTLAVWGTM